MIRKLFIENTNNWLIQFIRYFFVGGIAAIVNFLFLFIFTDIFNLYYLLSNVLAFIFGLITNYVLSKKFVFRTDVGNKKIEFLTYGLIGVIGLIFDTGLLYFFTSITGLYYLVSKILSTVIVFIWNFTARKLIYILWEKK
ncbi:MAG: GtrA family protein [Candidatus Symbiothrix sp.]|jgi:putative flippase GtrA|nr:GtrA family protein [Candidatus Symbiothrix sp.]